MNFKGLTITNWGNRTWHGELVTDNNSGVVSSSISNVQEYFGEETYAFGYEVVADILQQALDQAQSGKGKERHGQGLPFTEQKIFSYQPRVAHRWRPRLPD